LLANQEIRVLIEVTIDNQLDSRECAISYAGKEVRDLLRLGHRFTKGFQLVVSALVSLGVLVVRHPALAGVPSRTHHRVSLRLSSDYAVDPFDLHHYCLPSGTSVMFEVVWLDEGPNAAINHEHLEKVVQFLVVLLETRPFEKDSSNKIVVDRVVLSDLR